MPKKLTRYGPAYAIHLEADGAGSPDALNPRLSPLLEC